MDRIQLSQPATLNASWERVGVGVDPTDPVNVTVTYDSDGHTVTGTATGGPGTSRTFALTAAQTANLDYLNVSWAAADGSTLTTYAEIVGDFLFSVAQARLRSPLQDATAYPASAILFYRTLAEMAIEDICGVAFVPRYLRETMSISGFGLLSGSRRRIRTVRQITTWAGGTPNNYQPLPNLSGLQIISSQEIYMPTLWNWFSLPVFVAYEHGYDYAPFRVQRAALELARRWLIESPWDERTTGFRTRDGGEMMILTASHTNAFDIPEVEAVATAYGTPMIA
jgi:hypothetical protein